jgi:hypothetical protein
LPQKELRSDCLLDFGIEREGDDCSSTLGASDELVKFGHENADRKATGDYRKGIIEYIFHLL